MFEEHMHLKSKSQFTPDTKKLTGNSLCHCLHGSRSGETETASGKQISIHKKSCVHSMTHPRLQIRRLQAQDQKDRAELSRARRVKFGARLKVEEAS